MKRFAPSKEALANWCLASLRRTGAFLRWHNRLLWLEIIELSKMREGTP